ncbi:MAG: hypothetical protein KGV50_00755 [Gammaproteobacteria bacterium]|nr:hypothetical protein [Gammaproteobacteria bacterium]
MTIQINTYSKKELIKSVTTSTKDEATTVIQADSQINYEFIDNKIGKAPNHIVLKRSGDDLLVSFEKEAKNTDLIIKDFYVHDDQALIGLAENDEYYYYIPDTGEVEDYVTQLLADEIEGHALGGEQLIAPFWIPWAGFPWWIGALAAAPLLIRDNDSDKSPSNVPPVTKDDTKTGKPGTPTTIDVVGNDTDDDTVDPTTVKIDGATDPDGKTKTVPGEGTWSVDPSTGEITFTPEPNFTDEPTPIKYTVEDNDGEVSKPTEVTVTYPNVPPVTKDDTKTGKPGTPITIDVVGNDTDDNTVDPTTVKIDGATDPDGKTKTVPGEGTWSVDPSTGEITFTPEPNFTDEPTPIKYTVEDNDGHR